MSLGFAFNSAGRVMTLFSAINYCGDGRNSGAIVDIGKDLVCIPKIIRHVPDLARQMLVVRGDNRLRESMHGDLEEDGEDGSGDGKLLAVALFPFHKEKPLELSLTVGDVVEVLNQDVRGLFCFVQFLVLTQLAESRVAVGPKRGGRSWLHASRISGEIQASTKGNVKKKRFPKSPTAHSFDDEIPLLG